MSRYAQRPAALLQQQQFYAYPNSDSYFSYNGANSGPRGYPEEGDDDDTLVQTDVSALPPQTVHAQFRSNPVANTQQFDNSLPPEAIQRYGGGGGDRGPPGGGRGGGGGGPGNNFLSVPVPMRQRATSLDGRRSSGPPMALPQVMYGCPPPPQQPMRKMSRFSGIDNYDQPAVRYAGGDGPSLRQGRLPNDNEDNDSDEDEDKFTAVSSGVQPDEEGPSDDDDDATEVDYRRPQQRQQQEQEQQQQQQQQRGSYNYDPREMNGMYLQRSLSAAGGFDSRQQQARMQQRPNSQSNIGWNVVGLMKNKRKNNNGSSGNNNNNNTQPFPYQGRDFGSFGGSGSTGFSDPYSSNMRSMRSDPRLLAPPQSIARPASAGAMRSTSPALARPPVSVQDYNRLAQSQAQGRQTPMQNQTPVGSVPEDTPEEKNLIRLLKDMNFSQALKDFHNRLNVGVQKTLVAADGYGHAYVKIHCKKLPKPDDLKREPHLARYWVPLGGSRWHFKTESHKVEVVWKTIALAAYEQQVMYGTYRR